MGARPGGARARVRRSSAPTRSARSSTRSRRCCGRGSRPTRRGGRRGARGVARGAARAHRGGGLARRHQGAREGDERGALEAQQGGREGVPSDRPRGAGRAARVADEAGDLQPPARRGPLRDRGDPPPRGRPRRALAGRRRVGVGGGVRRQRPGGDRLRGVVDGGAAAAAEQATAEEDAAAAMEVDPPSAAAASSSSAPVPGAIGEVTREALKEMHRALDALSAGDLTLALAWVAEHGDAPVQSGRRPRAAEGTLAYELERLPLSATLHTLRFAQLLSSEGEAGGAPAASVRTVAPHLPSWRQLQRKLLGALAYARRPTPAVRVAAVGGATRGAAARFRGECMQTLGLPRTSALQTASTSATSSLLLSVWRCFPQYAASWKAEDAARRRRPAELGGVPLDLRVPDLKGGGDAVEPPMMLPCGHAPASSVAKLRAARARSGSSARTARRRRHSRWPSSSSSSDG